MNLILLFFTYKYNGDWDKIYQALEKKERVSLSEIKKLQEKIKLNKIKFFTILDNDYPNAFKETYKPPFVIFYKGNLELLKEKNYIALTGDNKLQNYHEKIIDDFSIELFKKYNLVTSLYKGTDEKVTKIAIEKNKKIIFISANGINDPYLSITMSHFDMKKTLFMSEYPPTHISKNKLRARNRLTSSLAKAIVLLNSHKESGSMNLITNALNLGKEIMCIPDSLNLQSGNNELIKQGATLVTTPHDIIKVLA